MEKVQCILVVKGNNMYISASPDMRRGGAD